MKKLKFLLFLPVLTSCSLLFPQKPLEQWPVGAWKFEQAYFMDNRQKIPIDHLEDKTIDFKNNRTFELKNTQNEIVDIGKWRISDFGFNVDYVDSTGMKSSSDSKKIMAIFSNQNLDILGEVSFSKKGLKIEDRDGKYHKYFILKKKE
ncbi:hypothetical protein [Lacihabitans soyangensis]|uniref:Lipocalin-like domain-containing protein n=1 Tax=Lacihabitans soyangensis TaxID=869394 RepID=A0AAE3H200_9BACT|nr:hypothetical protein [Lacihabitans soyangensis]MCP9762511.1 hypothetical protein [Lacihabitans soyangensis]